MDMTSGGVIRPLGGRSGHSHRAEDVNAIPDALVTAIGDLIVGGPDANPSTLSRGPDGYAVVSDDAAASGLSFQEVSQPGHEHDYAAPDHTHTGSVPVGGIVPYAGSTAPSGWLVCNGAEVLASRYPLLADICGTTYGVATQSGFFVLPSLQGRFPLGASPGTYVPGDAGGSTSVTLTEEQIPAHTHAGGSHTHETQPHTHTIDDHFHSTPAHNHDVSATISGDAPHAHTGALTSSVVTNVTYLTGPTTNVGENVRVRAITVTTGTADLETTSATTSHQHSLTATTGDASSANTGVAAVSSGSDTVSVSSGGSDVNTGATGGGQPVDTRPPYLALTYIIRAE